MTDLGTLSYFLGLEFAYIAQGIFMHQKKYTSDALKRFNMWNCNSIETPTEVNLKLQKVRMKPQLMEPCSDRLLVV